MTTLFDGIDKQCCDFCSDVSVLEIGSVSLNIEIYACDKKEHKLAANDLLNGICKRPDEFDLNTYRSGRRRMKG